MVDLCQKRSSIEYRDGRRAGWQKAVVVLANKSARVLLAVIVKGVPFDHKYVGIPGASVAAGR